MTGKRLMRSVRPK